MYPLSPWYNFFEMVNGFLLSMQCTKSKQKSVLIHKISRENNHLGQFIHLLKTLLMVLLISDLMTLTGNFGPTEWHSHYFSSFMPLFNVLTTLK